MTEFERFQRHFTYYQRLFGLTGWKVYFKHEPIEDGFASITTDHVDRVATVRLNSDLLAKDRPYKDIKGSAKHEALHLLLARIEGLGRGRYITRDDLYEAAEEAVRRLEELIP